MNWYLSNTCQTIHPHFPFTIMFLQNVANAYIAFFGGVHAINLHWFTSTEDYWFHKCYCSWIVYKNILFKNYNCLTCNYKKIKNKIMMYGYDSTIMLKTLPSITFFIKETAWKSSTTMQIPFWGLLRQLCIWNIDSTEKDLLFHISLNLRG